MDSTESVSASDSSGKQTPVMSELSLPEPVITGDHYMDDDVVVDGTDEQVDDTREQSAPTISEQQENVDVSRAGRKRKANTRYMDEPSPVSKPVVRRSSQGNGGAAGLKKKIQPPSPKSKSNKATSGSSTPAVAEEVVTGPPAFSQFLFKNKKRPGRKMSGDTFSEDDEAMDDDDLEQLPELPTSDDEEEEEVVVEVKQQTKKSTRSSASRSRASRGGEVVEPTQPEERKMMPGTYIASGMIGPVDKIVASCLHGSVKISLQSPANDMFPNVIPTDENGERIAFTSVPPPRGNHVPIFAEIGGGGPLALLSNAPVFWLRDEIPKLSAYFKKKMMGSGASVSAPAEAVKTPVTQEVVPGGTTVVRKLSDEEKAEKRRRKEEERRRILEERVQRRERERLKQLYRQHWLALTKFPIDDNLLHSRKGVRRLGHAPPQCRQIASPIVYWDCLLGEPGSLDIPLEISAMTTGLLDEIFVVWNFFNQFGTLMCPPGRVCPSITLPQLVEAFSSKKLHPLITVVHEWILGVLRPYAIHEIDSLLAAEQQYESQLVKNRGRAKLYWPTFSEFRDYLFLGHCVMRDETFSSNWLWLSIYIAKATVVLDPVDPRRDFLASVSGAFEEVDFEYKWLFNLETSGNGFMYESISFIDRLRLCRLLVNKIASLPWTKILVDKFCDARIHVSSEIAYIEKEERKSNQKIAHCQKLQSIVASGEPTAYPITLPMTDDELKTEIAFRDSLVAAKKIASNFVDARLAVRLESIGKDRFFNEYFQISSMKKIVFVRQHSVTHPNVIRYGVYDSLSNLELLIQSLDDRGVREHGLKSELQKIKANLFSDLVANISSVDGGEIPVNQTSINWLSETCSALVRTEFDVPLGPNNDSEIILSPLAECVDVAKEILTMIRAAWYGLPHRKRKPRSFKTVAKSSTSTNQVKVSGGQKSQSSSTAAPVVKEEEKGEIIDDDDVTVEEDMSEDVAPPEVMKQEGNEEEEKNGTEDRSSGDITPLDDEDVEMEDENSSLLPQVSERNDFVFAISELATCITESIRNSLLSFSKPNETSATASSVMIQFHIKTGEDLLRHLNIPSSEADIERRIEAAVNSTDKVVEFTSIVLDGLLALDEVIHDELARHEDLTYPLEVWPVSGGEKHAWRKFVGFFKGMDEVAVMDGDVSPPAEEEDDQQQQQQQPQSSKGDSFSCDSCGKQFKYHILLGIHKLHPCKTRGRKPIPVEPFMEVKPIPAKNGMLVIEKLVLPTFPPPPSSRASVAAAAAAAAAAVPEGVSAEATTTSTTTGEFVCELCGKVFPHNQGLSVHQTRWCIPEQQAQLILNAQQAVGTVPTSGAVDEASPLPCPVCGKMFPTAQGLAIHQNRWCSGASGDGTGEAPREPPKIAVAVGPLFKKTTESDKDRFVRVEIEDEDVSGGMEDEPRHPGYTPACYSLSAVAIAVLWYSNNIRTVLEGFTSQRNHHSRGASKSKRK